MITWKNKYAIGKVFTLLIWICCMAVVLSCSPKTGGKDTDGHAVAGNKHENSSINVEDDASFYLERGDASYGKMDYTSALENYVKGLRICELKDEKRDVAVFYKNIGNIYCLFEDLERGGMYYKTGLDYCRKYGDKTTEMKILINLTGISTFMNRVDEARGYYNEFVKLGDSGDDVIRFMGKYNYGLILLKDKKYREAADIYHSLVKQSSADGIAQLYECSAYQQIYRAYLGLGKKDSALYYMKKCEAAAKENNMQYRFIELQKDISKYYETAGDMRLSQEYKSRYLTMKDSIYNMREFDVVKHAQFLYEMDKVEKEISGLQTEKDEFKRIVTLQRTLIGVVLFVMLAVSVFLIILYKQKKDLNESYSKLYAVNRKFVENQESMKQRISEYKDRIREQDDEIKRLDKTQASNTDEPVKYQSSGLNDTHKQALVEAITDVMERRMAFCDDDFSLDKLADSVGSNSKYVSQVINDTYGKNFSNFVNEYRVNLASMRLADIKNYGNYTIRAVAESVGFKSYSTFNNVFRKITGITPSMYQKMAMKDENIS